MFQLILVGIACRSAKYQFDGWHLAFEVSLKKIVHSPELEASPAWIARFKDSLIFKEHGNRTDRTLEYIVLDLEDGESPSASSHCACTK